MTFRIIIYMASGRVLSETHDTKEQCIEAMEKIDGAIRTNETFWFGRSRVNPRRIEAFFVAQNGQELYDDESRRIDPKELIKGHVFSYTNGHGMGMWGSI